MVFVLEELVKIRSDRLLNQDLSTVTYIQETDDFLGEMGVIHQIATIPMQFISKGIDYPWMALYIADIPDIFTEAYANAGIRGNKNTPGKQIITSVGIEEFGGVMIITDQGEGFDYEAQIRKLISGQGHDFKNYGGGMNKFHATPLNIAYHDGGRTISIATPIVESR